MSLLRKSDTYRKYIVDVTKIYLNDFFYVNPMYGSQVFAFKYFINIYLKYKK